MKNIQIDNLKQEIVQNNICFELSKQAKKLVMGDGNLNADIVFIGEAPGKKEDETGMPFVGASGKLLNELLSSINLKREDVYITNIVKYRPPENRDPSQLEKEEFSPYLKRQLEIINPKIIVTLGRHSMEYFLPDRKISEIHGQVQSLLVNDSYVKLVPMYHPAAAIYNRKLRQTLFDDFKTITE